MSWYVKPIPGFKMSHPYVAHDPNCREGPHPTRDCRCKVFKTVAAAEAYIKEEK